MMEQHLFIFLFVAGFAPLSLSVSRKYFLIQEGKTWSDAQAYCKANYHDLAIIQNKDDVVQVQNEIRGKQFKSSAWIGLYMDISWSWSFGNVPLGSFIAWSFPPPDYDCAVIYPRGWIDTPCSARFPVVCFDETKTGNGRYIFVPATMVWLDAQKYCRQHYTDLASSRDTTENSVIMNLVPDWTWFGLFRNSWKWIDKTVFSTWKSGNPNNALKDKNCGYLNNSLADNGLCTNIMPFICYVEPQLKKQQTIKIKIQSNQDPHDPALKVAILEQIEQKLKNQGLFKNITVKFREQPDGKFFYMIN